MEERRLLSKRRSHVAWRSKLGRGVVLLDGIKGKRLLANAPRWGNAGGTRTAHRPDVGELGCYVPLARAHTRPALVGRPSLGWLAAPLPPPQIYLGLLEALLSGETQRMPPTPEAEANPALASKRHPAPATPNRSTEALRGALVCWSRGA
jgi:hypothetical protein